MMQHALVLSLVAFALACNSGAGTTQGIEPTPSAPRQAPPPKKDVAPAPAPAPMKASYAIVLKDDKLVRDYGNKKTEVMATVTGTRECLADSQHRVVWTLGPKGVATFDIVDKGFHAVVPTDMKIDRFAVHFFEHPQEPYPSMSAGNVNELTDCVALAVLVSTDPTVSGAVVADGDQLLNCYDDINEETLSAQFAPLMSRYNEISSFDSKYLKALDKRRPQRKPTPEAANQPAHKAPTLKVDKARCPEAPEDCGKAAHLGKNIWTVITGNAYGDLYYEERQLYDAASSEFFHPTSGKRSATPLDPAPDLDGLLVSPDKAWAVLDGKRISLTEGKPQGKFAGQFCGWGPL